MKDSTDSDTIYTGSMVSWVQMSKIEKYGKIWTAKNNNYQKINTANNIGKLFSPKICHKWDKNLPYS